MIKIRKLKKLRIVFLINLIILFNVFYISNLNANRMNSYSDENSTLIRLSAPHSPIIINGNGAFTAGNGVTNPGALGTISDPYIIEDWIIDGGGSGSCILIENTDKYFLIKNCAVYNSGSGTDDAGIRFENVVNGKIINSDSSSNNAKGIRLYASNNNIISNNTVYHNSNYGIMLRSSNNNEIKGNKLNNNRVGIHLHWSNFNTISKNEITKSRNHGFWFVGSDSNTIKDNTILESTSYGVLIAEDVTGHGDNNDIYNNSFVNNTGGGIQGYDEGNNNDWNIGSLGNYWNDYGGVDVNDDGIGDTSYSISGSAGSQDNYPIWDDGDDIFPNIKIISPTPSQLFGTTAPNFNVEIYDLNLDTMWYTIDGGVTNITYTTNGTIDQNNWTAHIDGLITIRFYANDTVGHINSAQVIINKDASIPDITIISPTPDQLFNGSAPSFDVEISDPNLDTMWYTIDGGVTNITYTTNGTIDQNNWTAHIDGSITITFYANDTLGYINSVQVLIYKDTSIPSINIISPTLNQLFGDSAPSFEIEISDPNLDTMWYTIDGGLNNYTFINNGTINQTRWNLIFNGTTTIKFYANDTLGIIAFQEVIVRKDIESPILYILSPTMNEVFEIPPAYEMTITEANLDKVWYTFNNGTTKTFITDLIGVMDLTLWSQLPNGYITIRFYANDTLGNISFDELIVVKDTPTPSPPPGGIPGYNVIILLGMVSLIAAFIIRRKFNKK